VIYGMPQAAAEWADAVLPLDRIAAELELRAAPARSDA
jgi:hypothetical protein